MLKFRTPAFNCLQHSKRAGVDAWVEAKAASGGEYVHQIEFSEVGTTESH